MAAFYKLKKMFFQIFKKRPVSSYINDLALKTDHINKISVQQPGAFALNY